MSIALGLTTGGLLGLLGGGGSIVAVPIMVYVLGVEAKAAIGTSLLIIGVASLLAAIGHYRKDSVLLRTALLFGGAGAAGSYAGAQIGKLLSDRVQLILFACIMAVIGVLMVKHRRTSGERKTVNKNKLAKTLISGCAAGTLTGLLGVGGGFIIVPALTFVVGLNIKEAVGTSLVIIGMNSLVGAATYASSVQWGNTMLPFVAGTIAAAPVAGHFSHHVSQNVLKTAFGITLLALSGFMLAKQFLAF
ncbi:MAG TPA: sulfite exporter TauE/SafE family protein [Drouetiella sp.]